MLVDAILLGLLGVWSMAEYGLGSLYTSRPIVLGAITGFILGDPVTGIKIGAAMELIFIGNVSIGGYIPPDAAIAGILGTAFAIASGQGAEAALAFAMPLALASLALTQMVGPVVTAVVLPLADKFAAAGNGKGVRFCHLLFGGILCVVKFLVISLGYYFGSDVVSSLIAKVPEVVIQGLSVASGILPTLGFAMLMRAMMNKKLVPYYFLGFALAAFLNMPIIGVSILGIVFVIDKFDLLGGNKNDAALSAAPAVAAQGGNDDEEF